MAGASASREIGSDSAGVGRGVKSPVEETGGRTGLCLATGEVAGISTAALGGLADRSDGVRDEITEAAELPGGAIGAERGPGAGLI